MPRDDALRKVYRLTEKGHGLLPVLIALLQWGDRWLQSPDSIPMRVVDRATGRVITDMRPRSQSGEELALRDMDWIPGPGAAHPRIAPLVAAYEAQRPLMPQPAPLPPLALRKTPPRSIKPHRTKGRT